MAIQLVPSDCSRTQPLGSALIAIEDADIIEAEKAAFENVGAFRVLAIHPPGEIHQELVKHAFEKGEIGFALDARIDFENAPGGPGMDGRIYVAERPFVSGQLAVRVHVPFAHEQRELRFREIGIGGRNGNRVKREIPGGVPRILPFVGH